MADLRRGDIVLGPFQHSDLRGMKRRPACVVSADGYNAGADVVVAMVTSSRARRESSGLGDVVISEWAASGLRAPTTIRAGRIPVIEQRLVGTTLGALPPAALAAVDEALREVLGLH